MPRKSKSKLPLKGKKLEICKCYYDNLCANELPPTFKEIESKVERCTSSKVHYYISSSNSNLVKSGYIRRTYDERQYRNYELTEDGIRCVEAAYNIPWTRSLLKAEPGIPLLGTTAAGQVLRSIFGEPGEMIDIGNEVKGDNIFALQVSGNSMIGDHINDGDYVFVRRQSMCADGDIVVVSHIDSSDGQGYATLKHFFRKGNNIHLQSSNSEIGDIIVPKQKWGGRDYDDIENKEWLMEGKVIAIFRRLHSS